jgi:hypothetical protein
MLPISVLYVMGVFFGNGFLRIGDVLWWERIVVWLWPVALPLLLLGVGLKAIFWA